MPLASVQAHWLAGWGQPKQAGNHYRSPVVIVRRKPKPAAPQRVPSPAFSPLPTAAELRSWDEDDLVALGAI